MRKAVERRGYSILVWGGGGLFKVRAYQGREGRDEGLMVGEHVSLILQWNVRVPFQEFEKKREQKHDSNEFTVFPTLLPHE